MGTRTIKVCTCDICGIQIPAPHNGGERGTFRLDASEDYAVAGGAGLTWRELCRGCNSWLGRTISDLQNHQKEMRKVISESKT